jgi:hypothetical protein
MQRWGGMALYHKGIRDNRYVQIGDVPAHASLSSVAGSGDQCPSKTGSESDQMNARKYAWQILHADIRRRVDPDENKGLDLHPQLTNIGALYGSAIRDGVLPLDIIIELAGFGATYALMPRTDNDPVSVAKRIQEDVMAEPDDRG